MKILSLVALLSWSLTVVAADNNIDRLRGADLSVEPKAPRMEQVENKDIRRQRNYPMQPPTIPHKIDGYQIDINSNKCLTCHSRHKVEDSQAPMISVTHYMDRDGNFLAEVSPRRYFCNQCHITQTVAKPLVNNTFQDVDTILKTRKP
jgi:cytochrome c-type protein NapB